MSRFSRRPARRPPPGSSEDMMAYWLRNRGPVDAAIDRDVARSCAGKDTYASEGAARAVAAMNGMSAMLFTYECRYCSGWHLTRRKPGTPPPLEE